MPPWFLCCRIPRMALKRRIVLDISQLKPPVEIAAPEEIQKYGPAAPTRESRRNRMVFPVTTPGTNTFGDFWRDEYSRPAYDELTGKRFMPPRMSMPDFLKSLGINKTGITCKGCGEPADFMTDNSMRTISCATCDRTVTFESFAQEHR